MGWASPNLSETLGSSLGPKIQTFRKAQSGDSKDEGQRRALVPIPHDAA